MLDFPHRRLNALTGEWVLVSPHRTKRPWQGHTERPSADNRPAHDPTCYLCPGNTRANGEQNLVYTHTYVFNNDFAALLPDSQAVAADSHSLLHAQTEQGICRVICFSPRHDLTLPEMPVTAVRQVVDVWAAQMAELSQQYRWVQLFENKGEIMGCSNPHPHGQVWAQGPLDQPGTLPNEPAKEDAQQHAYFQAHQRRLLLDYAELEASRGERVVVQNSDWLVVVPYWAVWPFELLLLPRFAVARITDLTTSQRDSLAVTLKQLLTKYDNLFEVSFPYSMGWHGAPNGMPASHWQLHAHFYPPLLRSATVKKFMVGYEMLAEAQRDLTAEQAAERLRALSDLHYKER